MVLAEDTLQLIDTLNLACIQQRGNAALMAGALTDGTPGGKAYMARLNRDLSVHWDTVFSSPNYHWQALSGTFLHNGNMVFSLLQAGKQTGKSQCVLYWADSTGQELQQKVFYLSELDYLTVEPRVYAAADGGMWFWFSKDTSLYANMGFALNDRPNYIAKLDAWGNLQWDFFYANYLPPYSQFVRDFAETPDGGLVIAGDQIGDTVNGRGWIVRLDNQGNKLWEKAYELEYADSTEWGWWTWNHVAIDTDSSILAYGLQSKYPETWDCGPRLVFARYRPDGTLATELPAGVREINVWPNPVSSGALGSLIQLSMPDGPATVALYSATGQLLREQPVHGPTASLLLPALPAGVYWLHIFPADGSRITRKLVMQ